MGYSVTLVATPAARLAELLGETRMKVTTDAAIDGQTPLSVGKIGTQAVFWRDHRLNSDRGPINFLELSHIVPLMVLEIVDSAGAQSVAYYDSGEERWSVSFWPETEEYLAITGEVPVDMERLTAEAKASAGGGEDDGLLYAQETPALVFRDLTGFAYDESDRSRFRVVNGDFPKPKPWWKFW